MGWNRVKSIPGGGVYPADGKLILGKGGAWTHKTEGGTYPIYSGGDMPIVYFGDGYGGFWKPNEKINDAFMIVEHLKAWGWSVAITYERFESSVVFRHKSNELFLARAVHEELPMAIFLAALKTLGLKYGQLLRRHKKVGKHNQQTHPQLSHGRKSIQSKRASA